MKLTWHLKDMDTFRVGDRVKNHKQKNIVSKSRFSTIFKMHIQKMDERAYRK